MAPPITSSVVLRSLYRSLLRASSPFSPPSPRYAAYASLLHRSGVSHDWDACVERQEAQRRAARRKREKESRAREFVLPHKWARNLTQSYDELREEYEARKDFYDRRIASPLDDDYWDDDESELGLGAPVGRAVPEEYVPEDDPGIVLFRHLLREWFAGGEEVQGETPKEHSWPWNTEGTRKQVPLMRFPSQILEGGGISIRDLIRREFRAPSAEEGWAPNKYRDFKEEEEGLTPTPRKVYPPSSYIDDEYRVQTAFRALAELNRKLAFATAIGLPASDDAAKQERDWKRLIQAAKGVSHCPPVETKASLEEALSEELLKEPSVVNDGDKDTEPDSKSSVNATKSDDDDDNISLSPLQCGTYLIAHPLMTGYFAKSVIVILDHTEEDDDDKAKSAKCGCEGGSGGTYGLIINRLALQQPEQVESSRRNLELMRMKWELSQRKKDEIVVGEDVLESSGADLGEQPAAPVAGAKTQSSSTTSTMEDALRPFSLLQAISSYDLPESVQDAFGDAPVRAGGPVNLSLQMIHRNALEGGEEESLASGIGGTRLAAEDEISDDSEDAIYFGGNAIKASLAVLDGRSDRDDFSFVIGASCWAPDQLMNEIERGCWLPFRGPPQMALTGMVDHNDVPDVLAEDGEDTEKGSKLSPFPPRPSNSAISSMAGSATTKAAQQQTSRAATRPVGDLWLSVMCALGEEEADLAFVLGSHNVTNPLADSCDNLDR